MRIIGQSGRTVFPRITIVEARECYYSQCDEVFIPKRKDQIYHSKECRLNASKPTSELEMRTCLNPECNKSFQPRRANQWHCDRKCQEHLTRAMDRKENKTQFIAIDGEGQPGKCRKCKCHGPRHTDQCASHDVIRHRMAGSFTLRLHDCDHFTFDDDNYPVCECGHSVFDHEHIYVLLGVGDDQYENINGFEWSEIFRILYSHYELNPDAAFIGFYLGYDFSQWIKPPFSKDKAWRLLTKEGRNARVKTKKKTGSPFFPVDVENNDIVWQLSTIPGRTLSIRPKTCACKPRRMMPKTCICNPIADRPSKTCESKSHKGELNYYCDHYYDHGLMTICDVGGFFQTSFLNVINPDDWKGVPIPWSMEDYKEIKDGKDRRSIAVLDDEERHYNQKENRILSQVMSLLNEALVGIGVKLQKHQWFGSGQIAQQLLRIYGAPKREDVENTIPSSILSRLVDGYYGGWFEIFMHGTMIGIMWEYDIRSAYPSVIVTLPCIGVYKDGVWEAHGEWYHRKRDPFHPVPLSELPEQTANIYRQVHAHVKGSNPYMGAALHREWGANTILCPQETSGWHWQRELEARQRAKLIDTIEVDEWIEFRKTCDCEPPLKDFRDLYQLRRDSESGIEKKVYKLGYNSLYGKVVQTVGDPRYSNPFWGSLITSGCRTLLADAIGKHPYGAKVVAKAATDAAYFLKRHPRLALSKELGDWEEIKHEDMTLFKPGVDWNQKTRDQYKWIPLYDEEVDIIGKGMIPYGDLTIADINAMLKMEAHNKRLISAKQIMLKYELKCLRELGDTIHYKRRGASRDMNRELLNIDAQFKAANLYKGEWPTVRFPVSFPLISSLQAITRNTWNMAGQLVSKDENYVTQDSNPSHKRGEVYWDREYNIWRTKPYARPLRKVPRITQMLHTIPEYESQPYEKRFGIAADIDSDRMVNPMVDPDGSVETNIKEMLGQ